MKHSKLEHIFALLPGIFGFVLLAGLSPACAQNVVIENRQSITVPGNYGSPWNISGDLTVGEHHAGELTIENSGVVSTGFQGRTGYFSGSSRKLPPLVDIFCYMIWASRMRSLP